MRTYTKAQKNIDVPISSYKFSYFLFQKKVLGYFFCIYVLNTNSICRVSINARPSFSDPSSLEEEPENPRRQSRTPVTRKNLVLPQRVTIGDSTTPPRPAALRLSSVYLLIIPTPTRPTANFSNQPCPKKGNASSPVRHVFWGRGVLQ